MFKFVLIVGFSIGLAVGIVVAPLVPEEVRQELPGWVTVADTFTIALPSGGSVTFDLTDGREVTHENVLQKMFEENEAGTREWLAKRNIFSIQDPALVAALNESLCTPVPNEATPPERRQSDQQCAETPVARNLNELRRRRQRPFHYVGRVVDVGIPQNSPAGGRANVCKESEFVGRTVRLTDESYTNEPIEVVASGLYACPPEDRFPDIQIGHNDAERLFGGGPLDQYQQALAFVVD